MDTHDWVFLVSAVGCLAWCGGLALGFYAGAKAERSRIARS